MCQSRLKIADKPICCALPNNNKSNPLINIFKMAIKLNSVEKTADTQIPWIKIAEKPKCYLKRPPGPTNDPISIARFSIWSC